MDDVGFAVALFFFMFVQEEGPKIVLRPGRSLRSGCAFTLDAHACYYVPFPFLFQRRGSGTHGDAMAGGFRVFLFFFSHWKVPDE